MKKLLLILLLLIFVSLLFTTWEKKVTLIMKQHVTEYFTPIEVKHTIDLDSLLTSYLIAVDTVSPFYKIIKEYDTISHKLKSCRFYNYKNELFAQECSWYWKYENYSEIIEDTAICNEFDFYRDWYKINFPNGGIIVGDSYLNLDGSRTVAYYHGSGCACCSQVNIKFKSVPFHDYDDPRKIIEKYHLTNQVLSQQDSEYQRRKSGAISFVSNIDSINHINLSITKLNNHSFNSDKTDVVIIKKETTIY